MTPACDMRIHIKGNSLARFTTLHDIEPAVHSSRRRSIGVA